MWTKDHPRIVPGYGKDFHTCPIMLFSDCQQTRALKPMCENALFNSMFISRCGFTDSMSELKKHDIDFGLKRHCVLYKNGTLGNS